MTTDIIDVGLKSLTDDELEELATFVEEKIYSQFEKSPVWELVTDFDILVGLIQSSNNLLTLTLDFDISGELTEEQLDDLQKELSNYGNENLKEELICRKNSQK
ncbi:MAG: hypothetical protein HGN29_01455 [Asgard group archaeon]|nr:hypothetical protein [Asgard group archaeon]